MGTETQTDLDRMLTRLKLTAVRDQLDTLLDEAARSEMTLRWSLARAIGLEPCVDGSRGARALFGGWVWSVAAMCTASDVQREGCAP